MQLKIPRDLLKVNSEGPSQGKQVVVNMNFSMFFFRLTYKHVVPKLWDRIIVICQEK